MMWGLVYLCEGVVILCGDGGGGVVFPCEGVVILCGDVGVCSVSSKARW